VLNELQTELLTKLRQSSVEIPAMAEENLPLASIQLLADSMRSGKISQQSVTGRTDENGDFLVTVRYKNHEAT